MKDPVSRCENKQHVRGQVRLDVGGFFEHSGNEVEV